MIFFPTRICTHLSQGLPHFLLNNSQIGPHVPRRALALPDSSYESFGGHSLLCVGATRNCAPLRVRPIKLASRQTKNSAPVALRGPPDPHSV
jgi:hypothetical protein